MIFSLRKKGKLIFWPAYFDINNSWGKGRRISKNLAVRNISLEEIFEAAKDLSLNPVLNLDTAFSKRPWEKTGHIVVDKKESKTETLKKIAVEIRNKRASR